MVRELTYESTMRRLHLLLWLAFLGSCGGGGSDPPQTLDGTWNATSQPVGSATSMTLKEQDSQLVGVGAYRIEAGASGMLALAGVHSGVAVTLAFAYDNGSKATYAALLSDSSHMNGALSFQGGGTSVIEFARQ
jgi:hypothetical protein